MSRIHDALKKAEQERAAALEAAPLAMPAPLAADPLPPPAPPATERRVERPSRAGALTLEALIANSLQPEWKPDPQALVMLGSQNNDHAGAEQFRTLRSRLYKLRERQPLKTLLITSAVPAEGKTFVSANLAQVIVRQHERRVLLIDADLRWSRLHQMLGTSLRPGLTDYLKGAADEFAVIQRSAQNNLFFIPGGSPVANANELISNGRMRELLDKLAPLFDWMIIDSPPAVPVSDASVLAGMCDGVLLVVRAESTPFDLAQKAQQEFQHKPVVGVVLNCVNGRSGYGSYYYSYYRPETKNGKSKD